jgi:hypothetical protein
VTIKSCGSNAAPAGYVSNNLDCCDDGGNLTLAARIFRGQTNRFFSPAGICGILYDYDCDGRETALGMDGITEYVNNDTNFPVPHCDDVACVDTWAYVRVRCGSYWAGTACDDLCDPASGASGAFTCK